ncbi:hypothetical protein CY0110_16012 [Crocosphaera chwakensis CCY0110]|uniref:Uncharacterized protein n=1 Tax=Crocosphaera chwakensis CCY0110 TaxID=391612 RepID=A3IHN4_9CHRO|nr:hypothetical protein CY0110_16012 [Crocosphaera chwakensis CCY0110]
MQCFDEDIVIDRFDKMSGKTRLASGLKGFFITPTRLGKEYRIFPFWQGSKVLA